jgi:hypothetical protein
MLSFVGQHWRVVMSESGLVAILAAVALVIVAHRAFLTGHWTGQQYCEKHTVITDTLEGGGDE